MRRLGKASILVREAKGHIECYGAWATKQALNRLDLLVLGLGPIAVLAVFLLSLPGWIGWPVATVLVWPALYAAFLILRTYARWGKK